MQVLDDLKFRPDGGAMKSQWITEVFTVHLDGDMNVRRNLYGNPSNKDGSNKNQKRQPDAGVRLKVVLQPKSVGFIFWPPWITTNYPDHPFRCCCSDIPACSEVVELETNINPKNHSHQLTDCI